ncbi:uncharacterized protein LOC144440318 [Glandiceps talaboti]
MYVMNLMFVIVVMVTLQPSIKTGNVILLLEVDTNKRFRPSHKRKLLQLLNAKLRKRHRTHSCDILELSVEVTEQLKKILRARQEVLFLFGIQRYVLFKVGDVKLNISGLMRNIKVHGRKIHCKRFINTRNNSLLCRSLPLSRKNTDLSTIYLNWFGVGQMCSHGPLQVAISSLSTHKQLVLQQKKQISKYIKQICDKATIETNQNQQINSLKIQLKTKEKKIGHLQNQLKTQQHTVKTEPTDLPDNKQPLDIPTSGEVTVRKEGLGLSLKWLVEKETGRGDAQFSFPHGVTWTSTGHLVVADTVTNQLIVLNSTYECISKIRFDNRFANPFCPLNVSVSNDNRYFITDKTNNQIIIYDVNSKRVRLIVEHQSIIPSGIYVTFDSVYVTTYDYSDKLIKYSLDCDFKLSSGYKVNKVLCFKNNECVYVAVNSKNQVLVSDHVNSCINVYNSDLNFQFSFNSAGKGQMNGPTGLDVDRRDNVYVCDYNNARIVKFSSDLNYYTCIDIDDEAIPENISVSKDTWPPKLAISDSENKCIWVLSQSEESY